jgi:hypothetical protein
METIVKQYREELEKTGIEPRSVESADWFAEKMKDIINPINRRELQREVRAMHGLQTPEVGRMYMFYYFPKGSATLPYFDMFPVIILMKMGRESFQGLNLHYLPLDLRQEFFLKALDRSSNRIYNKQTFLRIDYDYLNSFRKFRAFRPCFKQYALTNVKGRIINVPSSEWEIVMNLPTAIWRKRPEEVVHADSRRAYRKA